MASKAGIEATEATDVNRPIFYTVYDDLDRPTEVEQYDGDGVSVTTSNSVPTRPEAGKLRAKTKAEYDDQGRVFRWNWRRVRRSRPAHGVITWIAERQPQ